MGFHAGTIVLAIIILVVILIVWYKVHKLASEKFRIRPKVRIVSPSESFAAQSTFTPKTTLTEDMVPDIPVAPEPEQDFDPEFMKSREKVGGCAPPNHCVTAVGFDAENLGVRGDDMFDGDRTVTLGRKACKPSDVSVLSLLYKDTMELETNNLVTPDDCTYISNNIIYKQPCNLFEF